MNIERIEDLSADRLPISLLEAATDCIRLADKITKIYEKHDGAPRDKVIWQMDVAMRIHAAQLWVMAGELCVGDLIHEVIEDGLRVPAVRKKAAKRQ